MFRCQVARSSVLRHHGDILNNINIINNKSSSSSSSRISRLFLSQNLSIIHDNKTEHFSRGLASGVEKNPLPLSEQILVSILGPPNAGKSTLFNRFMCRELNKAYKLTTDRGKRHSKRSKGRVGHKNSSLRYGGAIVSATPGTTRDRRECIGRIGGTIFRLVDTAGVDGEKIGHLSGKHKDPLERGMIQQTLEAAKAADLVLLMFDAKVGVTSDLAETAKWLRKVGSSRSSNISGDEKLEHKRVVIVANKLEGDGWTQPDSPVMDHLAEASRVGFGDAVPISAEHGEGIADLAAIIEDLIDKKRKWLGISDDEDLLDESNNNDNDTTEKPLQLAILGRQNVGKSTLVNALLNENRVISGAMPGLTRDAIAVNWAWNGRPVKLVDTAGIRRMLKRNQSGGIEDLAVQDAIRAMKVADVAVLVLDADARYLQRQELAIADAVIREGRSIVVAANKMDLLVDGEYSPKQFAHDVQKQLTTRFPMLRKTPVVPMSSLLRQNVHDLMPVVFKARDRWANIISTGLLNRWLSDVIDETPPPYQNGRPTNIKYITQTKGRPPTFLLFCNVLELPDHYLKYLTRNFQDTFQMFGMEVRLAIKKSAENPFERSKKRSSGIGGKDARMKRLFKSLKETGQKPQKGRRRRFQKR